MYRHLTKLLLAGVVGVILVVAPAHATHRGDVHGGGGGGDGGSAQTLDSLTCATGQIAKYTGTVWECAADVNTDTNTNAATICGTDLLLDGDGDCVAFPSPGVVSDLQIKVEEITRWIEPKLVFVTDAEFTGDLGGLQGADTKCQFAAAVANVAGIWMAWLSGDGNTPSSRFTTHSLGHYYLLDGRMVAASFADLLDGKINENIDINEFGESLEKGFFTPLVWTGTEPTGGSRDPSFGECRGKLGDWRSASSSFGGLAGSTEFLRDDFPGRWTFAVSNVCNSLNRLYCFQQ